VSSGISADKRLVNAPEWRVEWVPSTGSTNDDVLEHARAGDAAGLVIATLDQQAGHGRQGRTWVAPAGSALAMSVLLRPSRPHSSWSLLPLICGIAVQRALAGYGLGDRARLKWPNDVLVDADERKLCGMLCVAIDDAVVAGIGINTAMTQAQLPIDTATSLHLLGIEVYERDLCDQVLTELSELLALFEAGDDVSVLAAYRAVSATVGRMVRAQTPSGEVTGRAIDIADDGSLVLETDQGLAQISAADVIHLRDA